MIGWNISITRQSFFIRRMLPTTVKTQSGIFVAAWNADCGGLIWIKQLLDEKKVICLQEGFYPGLYTGKAKNVLPAIQEIPPFVQEKYKWIEDEGNGKQILCRDGYDFGKSERAIASCNQEEWLHIKIWDLS